MKTTIQREVLSAKLSETIADILKPSSFGKPTAATTPCGFITLKDGRKAEVQLKLQTDSDEFMDGGDVTVNLD